MTNTKRPLRVFLCHASGDKPVVRTLYERLVGDGIDAWLDKEKLLPGQNWQMEIPKAVTNSDVVIVCLSSQSVTKEGFVQKEIRFALDVADEKPDGTIFIIPARLENCDVPERINKFQWVDLFSADGYDWLLKALQLRADSVGAIITPEKKKRIANKTRTSPNVSREKQELHKATKAIPQKSTSPKKTLSEKPVGNRESQDKSFLPIEGVCVYFSNEYLTSPQGKNLREFTKQGTLRLTQEAFVFSSEDFLLDINFDSIKSIETKIIPFWLLKPYKTKCIAVNYVENKKDVLIGLFPAGTTLEKKTASIWDVNKGVKDWIEFLKGIPKLSQKIMISE
jgi:hypothetical protein